MDGAFIRCGRVLAACLMIVALMERHCDVEAQDSSCPPAIYSFGDSLADTGNVEYAYPYQSQAEKHPYGYQIPFLSPAFRFSDGRLAIDFIAQAFSYPFLNPYMQLIRPDYSRGCNFAVSGSTATNITSFSLAVQVNQFSRFRSAVFQSESPTTTTKNLPKKIPPSTSFDRSLYIISIGGNDFIYAFEMRLPTAFIESIVIPSVLTAVSDAIANLYRQNARNFMVWSIPAQGCSPMFLTLFQTPDSDAYDELGCMKIFNQLIQSYNTQLNSTVSNLRRNLPGTSIIFADYYGANIHILKNAKHYGFNTNSTLKACCGTGGDYNYNILSSCGSIEVPTCTNPSEFVNWDGVHFTQAFSRRISTFFLTGQYMEPSINFTSFCSLDFSKFGEYRS